MKEYQKRVCNERDELFEKLSRLKRGMRDSWFASVPHTEQRRMRRQERIMTLYLDVLDERIENFG